MTDQLFDLTQMGGVGRQPITNVGRVAYNLRLDQEDIENRKHRGPAGSMYPYGSMDDKAFYVLPGDICLSKKQRPKRKQTDGMMTVFSSLNGYRADGLDHFKLIESLTFGGIAGGQGAKFDTTGHFERHPELVGIFGGLYQVVNNGNQRITNGQYVYWDLPEPSTTANDPAHREVSRITAVLRPYVPSRHTVTERAVKSAIDKSFVQASSGAVNTDSSKSVTDQAALRFKWAALQLTVNGLEALLSSGLVQLDLNAVSESRARVANASKWTGLSKDTREAYLAKVAAGIGCRSMHDDNVPTFLMPGDTKTVKQHICNLLTFEDKLVGYTDGQTIPSGVKGELLRNQESVIKDLLQGVDQANHFVSDRIVGRALTPFSPGQEGVISMGHYRQ